MAEQFVLPILPRTGNTFASWVPGSNSLVVEAARQWVAGRLPQLYLWGEPGAGVSHLLEAMSHEAEGALLLSWELLKDQSPGVLEGLEHCPYLLVDDLDGLAGQRDWEEALFHLYNRVRARQGVIAFGAHQPPLALGINLPDLSSRLAADAVFRVEALDEAGLLAMARLWAQQRSVALGEDVLGFLALRLPRNPTVWRQVLATLESESLAQHRKLTVPFVKSLYPDSLRGITNL